MRGSRCRPVALTMLLLPAIVHARPVDLDSTWSGDGVVTTNEAIVLTAGGSGSAKAVVKAKGAHLPLPALPFALALRVQLHSTDRNCSDTTFSSAGASINDTIRFIGRSD